MSALVVVTITVVGALGLLGPVGPAAAASARSESVQAASQTSPTPTSPTVSMPSIIPRPNSGAEPRTSTDRGGWVQWAVMGGMVVALGIIVLFVRRESHRKRAALGLDTPPLESETSTV